MLDLTIKDSSRLVCIDCQLLLHLKYPSSSEDFLYNLNSKGNSLPSLDPFFYNLQMISTIGTPPVPLWVRSKSCLSRPYEVRLTCF